MENSDSTQLSSSGIKAESNTEILSALEELCNTSKMQIIKDPSNIQGANLEIISPDAGMDLPRDDYYRVGNLINTLVMKTAEHSTGSLLGLKSNHHKLGLMVKKGENKFQIRLGEEFSSCTYRGQNKDFGKLIPSMQRINEEQDVLKYCVESVKKEEFKEAFRKTPYFIRLSQMKVYGNTFEFDLEALAQHYGFATNYIDTSTNMCVALFFAYTFYENGSYHPIANFDDYSPVLYVFSPHLAMPDAANDYKIVGFQAVKRPQQQEAMAVRVNNPDGIINGHCIRKIELPRDTSIANGIYFSFHHGFSLFPNEPISNIAKKILHDKHIRSNLLESFCEQNNQNYDEMYQQLKDKGYCIDNNEIVVPNDLQQAMHQEITLSILPWIAQNISYRPTYAQVSPMH